MMASGAKTMKPGVPWSVKGIEPKARESAKDAARQAGMTLGEWLNHTILEQEREQARSSRARKAPARKPARRETSRVDARLEEMSRKLDMLAGNVPAAVEAAPAEDPDPFAASHMPLPVDDIVDRIVRTERRTETAIDALRQDLTQISGRLERQPAVDGPGLAALEQTLSNVVDHIELTDKRNSDVLRTVQSRLSELSGRLQDDDGDDAREAIEHIEDRLASIVSRLDEFSGARDDGAYRALENKLTELARRVSSSHNAVAANPVVTSLEARVNQLTDKLTVAERLMPSKTEVDGLKTRLGQLQQEVSRVQTPARPAVLQAIESRLNTLASEIESLRADSVPHASFEKVTARLDDINSRLGAAEQGLGDSAPSGIVAERLEEMQRRLKNAEQGIGNAPSISAVEARFQEMQERLRRAELGLGNSADSKKVEARFKEMQDRLRQTEQGLGNMADTDSLESRLADLSRRLDQSLAGDGADPQIGKLSSRVEEIASRLDQGGGGGSVDNAALKDLEGQVIGLAERLDQTEQRFGGPLQSIEASLGQLYESIETSRDSAVQAAEAAAVRAAEKLLANQPDIAAGDAIAALERSLVDVKSQASNADRRTQETLEAVHDTLKRVIDRLGALEERGFRGASDDEGAHRDQADWGSRSDGEHDAADDDFESFRLPPLPKMPDLGDAAPGDEGDDEGLRKSPAFGAMDSAQDSADHETSEEEKAFASAYETESDQRPRNEDFIAAARRAAQAAGREGDSGAASPEGKPAKSGLLSFGRNRKRTLLYAAAALFLAAGALSMSGLINDGDGTKLASPTSTGAVSDHADAGSEAPAVTSAYAFIPDTAPDPLAAAETATSGAPTLTLEDVTPGAVAPRFAPTGVDKAAAGQFGPTTPGAGVQARPSETKLAPTGKGAPAGALAALGPDAASPAPANAAKTSPDAATAAAVPSLPLPPEAIGSEALRTAAANGDPTAQYEVARRFDEGEGVAADDAKAAIWFQRAAAQGHAPSQYRLGTLFEKGRGVDKDLGIARTWYERAAERGNRKAMHNLAVLLANNSLGQPDFTRAARWFLQAAELGLADSQFNIAILHERGLGVEADEAKAYKWLQIAAAAGDSDAGKRADALEQRLEASALARTRAEISTWRPRTPDPVANAQTASGRGSAWGNGAAVASGNAGNGDRVLVSRAQLLLAELGYDPGPVDGFIGPKTRTAIEAFQGERGLPVSGVPTVDVIRAMEEARG